MYFQNTPTVNSWNFVLLISMQDYQQAAKNLDQVWSILPALELPPSTSQSRRGVTSQWGATKLQAKLI